MKTLILSCNTGEGHNSCGKAIKEYYETVGEECIIKDGLEFISPKVSRFLSWGHSFVYRQMPWLFKFGYEYAEKHPSLFCEGSPVYKFMTRGSSRMHRYICDGGYDSVICTHVFTAFMLTDMLKKHPMEISTCLVATDYTCSPGAKSSDPDYCFIPDFELSDEFVCETIPRNKMIASGIPVRQMFYVPCAKEEAKMSVDVHPKNKHLLMMCGSMGCGPMEKILHRFSKELPQGWEITAVCGKHQKLEKKLKKRYGGFERIHVHGFVGDMGTMMDSADLYLTKPGGIGISEAMVKCLPMVLVDAVAGCEEYNRLYFVRKGVAVTASSANEIVELCFSLMENEKKRESMRSCFSLLKKQNSARIIYEKMKELTEKEYGNDLEKTKGNDG